MAGENRKQNTKVIYGGYRQFRNPRVFAGKKTTEQKERHFPWHLWKMLLTIILLIIFIGWVFISEKFHIKEIIIDGNSNISSEKLQSYFHKNQNIFLFSSKDLKRTILAENAEIKDLQIIRGIPDTIKIIVLEHDNKLIWQSMGERYLVSIQGKVTKKIESDDSFDFPIVVDSQNLKVTLGDRIVTPSFVSFINNINNEFFNYTNIKPTIFSVNETTFDVNLATDAGFYVKFDTMRSSTKQLENLKKVLVAKRQDILEYVDLRIDGWAYYK